jgi:repressor LexA
MTPDEFKRTRLALGLTQQTLADQLKRKRLAIVRYEGGARRIPGVVEVALHSLGRPSHIPLVGIVAAGDPIEPIPQTERVEVPKSMLGRGETFALRVKGSSMRDDGILPGDVVVVQKQDTARNGQTVIALWNGEATIKTYHRKAGVIELHPANETMTPMIVKEADTFHIEGIVVGVIRHLRR